MELDLDQSELLQMTAKEGIALEAYSPLASGQIPGDDTLEKVGEKYGKSAAQVAIRWLLEHDQVVALPRSSSHENRLDNFEVFGFELDDDDRRTIDAMASPDGRQVDPDFAPEWD
jgi:diketogulonate reductase-like aldo/keto reductase